MSSKTENRFRLSGLIDRARKKFESGEVFHQYWWDSIDGLCETARACYGQILDDLGVRFKLDTVIPGIYDNEHFRNIGQVTVEVQDEGKPGQNSIKFQAPKGRCLIIRDIEITPVVFSSLDNVTIETFLRGNRRNNVTFTTTGTGISVSSFVDRVMFCDEDIFEIRFTNTSTSTQHTFDFDIRGWQTSRT